jgi:tetracycline repressor-like protein
VSTSWNHCGAPCTISDTTRPAAPSRNTAPEAMPPAKWNTPIAAQPIPIASAELFAAKPYAEVAVADVAERAGISRAALYQYFPGKRDLFAAIYRQAAGLTGHPTAPAVVMGWLVFVRSRCVDQSERRALSRSPAALSLRSHRRIGGRSGQKVV